MKKLVVVIACGGTGGHLFPGIAVAEEFKARGHKPLLLISRKSVDQEASRKYGELEFVAIPAVAKPATFSPQMIPFLWKIWGTIRLCKKILHDHKADMVIGMGGFTSLPPVYAGRKLRLKTFVHDSNALPGRANMLTARWCTRVFVGMKEALVHFNGRDVVVTGTPMRGEMKQAPSREAAAEKFGLDPRRPVVVVMGGSQGARRLNGLVAEAFGRFPAGTQVLHVAGSADETRVREEASGRADYVVLGFCDDMSAVYALADLVLCRAGASSMTELAHAGLPSILVPYPYAADDHQTKNAQVFAAAGAAKMVQQADLDAAGLADLVCGIIGHADVILCMKTAARALDVPDAAARVCSAMEAALK